MVVNDEFGVVQGLVTPLDVLEAIAGEFPDEDETPDIITDGDGWLVKGGRFALVGTGAGLPDTG